MNSTCNWCGFHHLDEKLENGEVIGVKWICSLNRKEVETNSGCPQKIDIFARCKDEE